MMEKMKRGRLFGGARPFVVATLALTLLGPERAWAEDAIERAQRAIADVELQLPNVRANVSARRAVDADRLLVLGQLQHRTGQHAEAIATLSKVIELGRQNKASAFAEADAEFLIAEAYFATDELHSARRHYEQVLLRSGEKAYENSGGKAASRLVDVALGLDRRDLLPGILESIKEKLTQAGDPALIYARAKAHLALGEYDEALGVADQLGGTASEAQRANYLRGVILMKQALEADPALGAARFDAAILAFGQAIRPNSAESSELVREINELAELAVARLEYERGRYVQAARVYQRIPRTSKHFAKALFELSWTYVRSGDYERAERALEALMVLEPGLIDGADAELLRADLLLRAGRFQEAEEAYQIARGRYEPLVRQIDDYLRGHEDPAVYYDQLTASEIELGKTFPRLALDWTREEAREERIFAILDDVVRSKKMVEEARRMAMLLGLGLSSSARAKIFPEVRRQLELATSLQNQLSIARLSLARGLDSEVKTFPAAAKSAHDERVKLMKRLGEIPTRPGDFSVRDAKNEKLWNRVTQSLQRLTLEADYLNALINGLRRVLDDSARYGITASPSVMARYRGELAQAEQELASHVSAIATLREQAEVGKVQSGFGDEQYQEDKQVRDRFRVLLSEEVNAITKSGDQKARNYAAKLLPVLRRIEGLESKLAAAETTLSGAVAQGSTELRELVEVEARAMETYAEELAALDADARSLVGEVARDNFKKVRDRVLRVVMRADVGLVQKSWEVREKQMRRIRTLLRERAREEKFINDELREVLDDAGEAQ
ncbi:MAG: hypothetical protein B6A08_08285 [Sorangiineae bacterium NIC37A_2]|jgi:tetratricopeptide (TPR) repeat protein|nr:MAG: hypothetical protein B6A08_08285 [Sorangiineae bacterium NIC37A_2]